MHKCIPYAKIRILRFGEPWWVMSLSERINAFPTNTTEQIPFTHESIILPMKIHMHNLKNILDILVYR